VRGHTCAREISKVARLGERLVEGDAQVSREFLSKMVVVLLERTEPASRNAKPACIAVWEAGLVWVLCVSHIARMNGSDVNSNNNESN